jgi:hypothetical protein
MNTLANNFEVSERMLGKNAIEIFSAVGRGALRVTQLKASPGSRGEYEAIGQRARRWVCHLGWH